MLERKNKLSPKELLRSGINSLMVVVLPFSMFSSKDSKNPDYSQGKIYFESGASIPLEEYDLCPQVIKEGVAVVCRSLETGGTPRRINKVLALHNTNYFDPSSGKEKYAIGGINPGKEMINSRCLILATDNQENKYTVGQPRMMGLLDAWIGDDEFAGITSLDERTAPQVDNHLRVIKVSLTKGCSEKSADTQKKQNDHEQVHVVRSGDSLFGISLEYGIPLTDLIKDNNVSDPNLIFPGQQIIIKK